VRLFEEIQDKSKQLAEASQHKSQFLALNAILGYTELMADGVYGQLPERSASSKGLRAMAGTCSA
jgi:hypothetical protein